MTRSGLDQKEDMPETKPEVNENIVTAEVLVYDDGIPTIQEASDSSAEDIIKDDVNEDTKDDMDEEIQDDINEEKELDDSFYIPDFIVFNSPYHCNGITYEILRYGSKRGHHLLVSSEGYSYSIRRTLRTDVAQWRCRYYEGRTRFCTAKIAQHQNGEFVHNDVAHIHPPNHEQVKRAKISRTMKEWAVKYIDEKPSSIAKRIAQKYHLGKRQKGSMSYKCLSKRVQSFRCLRQKLESTTPHKRMKFDDFIEDEHSFSNDTPQKDQTTTTLSIDHSYMADDHPSSSSESAIASDAIIASNSIIASAAAVNGITTNWDKSMNPDDYVTLYVPKLQFKTLFDEKLPDLRNSSTKNAESGQNSLSCASCKEKIQPKKDSLDLFFESLATEVREMPRSVRTNIKLQMLSLVDSSVQIQK